MILSSHWSDASHVILILCSHWLIFVRLLKQRQVEGWRLLAADIPDYLTKCDDEDMEDNINNNVAATAVSVDNFANEESAPLLLGDTIDGQLIIILNN